MRQKPAKRTANQRPNPDRQKRKAHVRALLSRGRQFRNVFVVARLLRDLAQSQHKQRQHCAPDGRPEGENQPGDGCDQCAQNDSLKCGHLANQEVHQESEADHRHSIRDQNSFIGFVIDIPVNVARKADVLLPEHDPVAGKDHQEPHKPADTRQNQRHQANPYPPRRAEGKEEHGDAQQQRDPQHGQHKLVVAHDYTEIPRDRCDRWRRRISGLSRLTKKKQNEKEHRENTERSHAVNILNAKRAVGPGGKQWPGGAADVDHRVINRITDRTYIRL